MMLPTSLAARSGARKASLRKPGNPRHTGDPTGPGTKLIREVAYAASGLVMIAFSSNALAEIAQSPLFMEKSVPPPNIMLIFDNSQNMLQESIVFKEWNGIESEYTSDQYLWDEYGRYCTNRCDTRPDKNEPAFYSSDFNRMYYNPDITYTPAMTADKQLMPSANPRAALRDGFNALSGRIDLTPVCQTEAKMSLPLYHPLFFTEYRHCRTPGTGSIFSAEYVFNYKWNGYGPPSGHEAERNSYVSRGIVPTPSGYLRAPTRTDCASVLCTYEEEIQNFANWFSYYRTRGQAMKTMLSKVFSMLDDRFRVGFFTRYDNTSNFLRIDNFSGAHRAQWYSKLHNTISIPTDEPTSVADALFNTGSYFKGQSGLTDHDPIQMKCQANYAIIATTGFGDYSFRHNTGADDYFTPSTFPVAKLYDPVAKDFIRRGSKYPPPYRRNGMYLASTLTASAAAMMNWGTDIGANGKGSTVGYIKPGGNDPANWQHIVTHVIRAGGVGKNNNVVWPLLQSGEEQWPAPLPGDRSSIDDLWHAAVNGHGRYIFKPNPGALEPGLTQLLKSIDKVDEEIGAGSSIAYAGTTGGATGFSYAAGFLTSKWSGYLKAYNAKNVVQWDAGDLLLKNRFDWKARNIVTWDAKSGGKDFLWGQLNAFQSNHLKSSLVVDYIRGDFLREQSVNNYDDDLSLFRKRDIVLGDIVNSTPLYVGRTNFGYASSPDKFGGAAYAKFLNTKGNQRNHMLYVGANDGMLHGFNAKTGVETFAFVPNSLFPHLKELSEPGYKHRYFVDGQMTEGDAYLRSEWRNILLGSTGAGSQSVFAIDITDPVKLGAKSILWELDASGDFSDLGHVLGTLALVRLTNGSWAAIFGNGYNSSAGKATLYIVDVTTGRLIKKLDTAAGTKTDPNGLSTPGLVFNSERALVAAYAGDLRGNLWKFDMASPQPGNWKTSKIFTATTASGSVAPIVQQPLLTPNPAGGFMISFGTGKYYETADKTNTDKQVLYGIWDKPGSSTPPNRNNLQQQTLTPIMVSGRDVGRTLSNHLVDWRTKSGWYIDMLEPGERFVGRLNAIDDALLISSTLNPIPSKVSCAPDIMRSFIMASDILTGSASPNLVLNGTGNTPIKDANGQNASSIGGNGTASNGVSIPGTGTGLNCLTLNRIDGSIYCVSYTTAAKVKRSWRQLPVK